MVQIKFIAQGSNSLVGGFSHGTVSRVTEALAKHLVEEAKVAVYLDTVATAATVQKPVAKPARKTRGNK